MQIVLFDTPISRLRLYPLSLTRPLCDIRYGIFSHREWYETVLKKRVFSLTEDYLLSPIPEEGSYYCIDASVIPENRLVTMLEQLSPGEMIEDEHGMIAFCSAEKPVYNHFQLFYKKSHQVSSFLRVTHPMDLVRYNPKKIREDIVLLEATNLQRNLSDSNRVFGDCSVVIQHGAAIEGSTLNTREGPIFIGENAYVMEGSLLRGPLSIGKNAVIKMGAQIYGGTTIGNKATAGGEIKNSILGDNSNKAHHGYLGDSITGAWCNLGAGTSNSNVKNNAGIIKMWNQEKRSFIPIANKAGVVLGDYVKTGINTSLNSGTTVGIATSIHKPGFPEKKVGSFQWGPDEKYRWENLINDLKAWHGFKSSDFSEKEQLILEYLYQKDKLV